MSKKLIPNPDYENALYEQHLTWIGDPPVRESLPVRTNNPRYEMDGCPEKDRIPSHIEVED